MTEPHVVGYFDPISVAPGDVARLMISSTDASVEISLVRLIHGDERGPGLKVEPVPSSLEGTYDGRVQLIESGSYIRVDELEVGSPFQLSLWVMPTFVAAGRQRVMTAETWTLEITDEGRLRFAVGDASVESSGALRDRVWYFVEAACDGDLELSVTPQIGWTAPSRSHITGPDRASRPSVRHVPARGPLFIGGPGFNGRIAAPRIAGVADWDLTRDFDSRHVADRSGNANHGRTVQMPTKGLIGPDGSRSAIHFNDDDLDDADWQPTAEWTVEDLPSGIYAAHVRSSSGEDYVPLVVRPPRDRAAASILLVAPLFSWLAYANIGLSYDLGQQPQTPHARYMVGNRLKSLYDNHSDGSGVGYSSWRRPLLDVRPNRFVDPNDAHQFAADLHLVDWLHHEGFDVDVVTDAEMNREGANLLGRYRVVLSGTHAEYWSAAMLDALEAYLADGGRYMYLSGNGLYCVTGFDEEERHTVEVRRYGSATSAWHGEPGERYLTTTGEEGGLWRHRGRPPQRYVGVGFSGCVSVPHAGPIVGGAYRRQPSSHDPRAAFIFEGIDENVIGDFPNLVFAHGAAGFELDRADARLGTPPHALVLASATEFPVGSYMGAHEEYPRYDIRADLVFFETPNGGAVFSTGSIAWCGQLSYNDYSNNVARITGNVLRRFASPQPFELPTLD